MRPRLVTIPISHYCEKARWALELCGIDYEESAHLQVWHYLAVRRAGGGHMVPALQTGDGVVTESSAIVRWAAARSVTEPQLVPEEPGARTEVDDLEAGYDAGLGAAGRLWMYNELLGRPDLARKYACTGVPALQRMTLPLAFPFVKIFLLRRLAITPERAREAAEVVDRTFDEVAARIQRSGAYLTGAQFTAADLAFAALAAPIVFPSNYGVPLPRLDELPERARKNVSRWRSHPAGAYALRLYRDHRPVRAGVLRESHPVDFGP